MSHTTYFSSLCARVRNGRAHSHVLAAAVLASSLGVAVGGGPARFNPAGLAHSHGPNHEADSVKATWEVFNDENAAVKMKAPVFSVLVQNLERQDSLYPPIWK